MASTYSTNLKIELIGTGDQSGTWGTTTNVNLGTAIEEAITGIATANFPTDADLTLTLSNTNTTQVPRHLVLDVTSGVSLTTTRNLIVPTVEKQYLVWNNTTGGQSIVVKTSAGTGITVPNGAKVHVVADGTNVVRAFDNADINSGSIDGTPIGANSASTGNFSTLSIAGSAITATAAELNVLDGITATTAELNVLDGITATTTELNYTDGVTSNIQTQLDAKAPLASPTFTGTVSATTVDTTNIEVTNLKAKDGTAAGSIADATGVVTLSSSVLTTTDINGGSIDGTAVGASSASTGNFTTLSINGTAISATATELNVLDGITATTAELNILDGVTATNTEINVLDGITATTAELNILDGVTATTAELNLLDGVTATTAELNYLDITTLGTSEASKAVTADANGDVTLDEELKAKSYNETVEAITSSGGAATINCENANLFTHTLSENVTYTFSSPPTTGTGYGFTLKVVQDSTARTITWPASVKWGQNLTPTISTGSGEVDVFTFFTHDGGTNWYGFAAGQDMS